MIPKSKTVRVLALLLSLTLAVTVLCGAAYAEDIEIEIEPADTETGTDLWDIPIWNPYPDEIVMDVDTEEPAEPETDYEINVDAPSWWVNEPMDIIVYLDDIYDSGWERIEAACDYDADERTDLTEQFWDSGLSSCFSPFSSVPSDCRCWRHGCSESFRTYGMPYRTGCTKTLHSKARDGSI